MPIRLDYAVSKRSFAEALSLARSQARLPPKWLAATATISESPARTFIPMLGTALLAKATDRRVDPFSLKTRDLPNTYSARSLCHDVLVPCAVEARVNIGTTGREPLNNQPFFRHERVDRSMVVRKSSKPYLENLCSILADLRSLDEKAALQALAAFLRVRLATKQQELPDLGDSAGELSNLEELCAEFLDEDPEGGRRGQAFVAACLALVFDSVKTNRVNDPSRHFPGDVKVEEAGRDVLLAEVKQKPVSASEILQFAARCQTYGVQKALVAALHPDQPALDVNVLRELARKDYGVHLEVADRPQELLRNALTWAGKPLQELMRVFPRVMAERLANLEVSEKGRRQWATLFHG